MTETFVPKMRLIGCGYTEMYGNGKRWRFHVERYVDDAGHEWGNILGMEEVPDIGPLLIIPSLGVEASELANMEAEYRDEQAHPTDQDLEWRAHRVARKAHLANWYRDSCEQRRTEANGNKRHFGPRRNRAEVN